jgi:hypothetical protein
VDDVVLLRRGGAELFVPSSQRQQTLLTCVWQRVVVLAVRGTACAGDTLTADSSHRRLFSPQTLLTCVWQRVVVLAVRGTACAGDTLTDCCADPVPFLLGHAHAGIVAATWQLVAAFVPRLAAALVGEPTRRREHAPTAAPVRVW